MRKKSNADFQTQLCEAVKAIENVSQAEIVVVMRPRSESYRDVPLAWGAAWAWLVFSYLMFVPTLYDDLTIYFVSLSAFPAGYLLGSIPLVTRVSVPLKRRHRSVETMARALFQKGGIGNTAKKIGILVYCSLLEKTVYLLPDSGAAIALPATEWQAMETAFQAVFRGGDTFAALLRCLNRVEPVLGRYLPRVPHDLNELPDSMDIDL